MSKSDLVDIEVHLHHETDAAYLVSPNGTKDPKDPRKYIGQQWLPKSLVEKNLDGSFTLPEWLAEEKDLSECAR